MNPIARCASRSVVEVAMLQGNHISLRPVREADLDAFYAAHVKSTTAALLPLGATLRDESAYVRRERLLAAR